MCIAIHFSSSVNIIQIKSYFFLFHIYFYSSNNILINMFAFRRINTVWFFTSQKSALYIKACIIFFFFLA